MKYLMAIDGGGTKTHCILYAPETDGIRQFAFGCTNYEYFSDGLCGFARTIEEMFAVITAECHISMCDIAWSVLGLAGVDTPHQHQVLSEILNQKGLSEFRLVNDAYLGIKAASARGTGICLINGTGCNTVGINESGQMYQIGAQFELTGDFGGGHLIGKEAIKTTYMNLFRMRRETLLTKAVMDCYQITSRHDLIDRVLAGAAASLPIARLAKCVFDCAEQGDPESIEILERMGQEYAYCVKMLLGELPFSESQIDLVLAGSLFTKQWSQIHLRRFDTTLAEILPNKSFKKIFLACPPVIGALRWVLEDQGIPDAARILERAGNCRFE